MKTYTIVAGVNGCGKSSLTGVLRTEIDNLGKIIDVDKITAACGGNLLEGGKKAITLIEECLEKEICFTQETTLSGRKTLDTIKRAIAKDYYIRLYYVGLDTMEESLLRIENRVKKGGHNINTDTVAARFGKRFEDLLAVLPYCNEATFYDNDNGFVTVAKYKNGELQTVGQNSPQWLKELIEKTKA
jgi:predicted ABC-type ATPase